MVMLHVLVPAVLVLVGQSTACVEWMIANPPIIFGKTAQLVCALVTSNSSSDVHKVTSWLGGKDYSTLTYNGGTADSRKYAETQSWHKGKFKSILQIYKFDEMDVNMNYSCSIGGCQNRKRLSLTPDKFEYHPDKDTTTVRKTFSHGHLDVIVRIMKVYPIPNCTIMFNENRISRFLTTKTSDNGIFYKVVEEVYQNYVDVCSGQLIVTCVVGKTEIPIHQETFNRCNTKTIKEESSPNFILLKTVNLGLVLLLCAISVIGIGCLVRYGQLKNALCCRLLWRGEESRATLNIAEIGSLLIPTHNAEPKESDKRLHRNSNSDSFTTTDI